METREQSQRQTQPGVFDAEPSVLSQQSLLMQTLEQSIGEITDVMLQKGSADAYLKAQARVFGAIRAYCNFYGSDNKERVELAQAVDQLIINRQNVGEVNELTSPADLIAGIHAKGYDFRAMTADEKTKFLAVAGTTEVPKNDTQGGFKRAFANVFRRSGKVSPVGAAENQTSRPESKKPRRLRAIAGVIGAAAIIAVGAMHLFDGGDESAEGQRVVGNNPTETTTTTTTTSSTTMIPNDAIGLPRAEEPESTLPLQSPPPPPPPPPQVLEFVTIETNGNVWNALQATAVGSSGREANNNLPLNREIAATLPLVSKANGGINLDEIPAGQQLAIPNEVAERLVRFKP